MYLPVYNDSNNQYFTIKFTIFFDKVGNRRFLFNLPVNKSISVLFSTKCYYFVVNNQFVINVIYFR